MDHRVLRFVACSVGAAALVGWLGWLAFRPRPNLEGLDRLMAGGQYQAAEAQLTAYLAASPGDDSARLLLARVSLNLAEPKPDAALELTDTVQPGSGRQAATIQEIRGEAFFLQQRYVPAEAAWLEALKREPSIAEVGWGLLNLYALQGRHVEANRLALQLYDVEPDPHDRLQLLLQMIRFDAHANEIGALIHQLQPVVQAHPDDLPSMLALGTALVREGRAPEGLDMLRKASRAHPDVDEAWLHLVEALAESGEADELDRTMPQVPPSASEATRYLAARGWLALQHQDAAGAARSYLEAFEKRPADPAIAYRLKIALHHAGRDAELAALTPRLQAAIEAGDKITPLYDRIDAARDLDPATTAPLYREVAAVLRSVGRVAEADLWDRLASPGPAGGQ